MSNRRAISDFALLTSFTFVSLIVHAQAPLAKPVCGKTPVRLSNAVPLTTSAGIFMVQPPAGWSLDQTKNNPFYFLKPGDTYQNARTLMYVNIERLDVPLLKAVEKDMRDFEGACKESRIKDLPPQAILEEGCERKTQMFYCDRSKGPWVDLVTKISISGLIVNVVLSADNEAEIARNKASYEFLLKHIGLAFH